MKSSDVKNDIVRLLSADDFISGEELGERLGMSRAAISKHIKGLQQTGLDIFSVHGRGYQLARNINILESEDIKRWLTSDAENLDVCNIVTSTNDRIKENIRSLPDGFVCVAEAQTAGRGRRGRSWFSPFGANIYLSMVWHFEGGFQAMSGLSLAVGVALCDALNEAGLKNARVKWPNDLLIDNQKLAGILIETEGYSDGSCSAIVGCGINFCMPEDVSAIDQPWTDVTSHIANECDRNYLVALCINHLRSSLRKFQVSGFSAFKERWDALHAFSGQEVNLTNGSQTIQGIAKGADPAGALIIDVIDEHGKRTTRHIHGGEVSVRVL